ncbi:hypothetical protein EPO17_03625 [Patescibacteria group bacterium]|nr:MAG: hypothetical protein EPO17_03625 [Patescibacteria group bacterium]
MKEETGIIRVIVNFFDKLEDRARAHLSRQPIIYAVLGGVGIVLFWRGVWHTADLIEAYLIQTQSPWAIVFSGPGTFIVGMLILLMTGLMVSVFIGDQIILSGIKKEKKLVEKTETEVKGEADILSEIRDEIYNIEETLSVTQESQK